MSLRIAFLGSGVATGLHTRTLQAVAPQVKRSYASREASRAAIAAARHGGSPFPSYEAAVASSDVDAVVVALPPALHLEWTLRALSAGKHVIVEKPPFLTTAEFDRASAAAGRTGRHLLVAENYFYKPLAGLLRTVISSGDLGGVRFIQLNALKRQPTGDWRDDRSLSGGGALFEGGIHWVSLLANIGLTPARVRAARAEPQGDVERSVLVTIEYTEGAVATLSYSWDLPGLINGIRMSRMFGTAGSLRFETNGLCAVLAARRYRVFLPGVTDLRGYRAMWLDFLGTIAENRPPAYRSDLARRDLQLVEDAYASLQH